MLRKQLFRGLWRARRSYAACVLLMSVGIAIYVGFHLMFVSLHSAMESLYRHQRFGDAFATVSQMPLSATGRISSIPGVEQLSATIVAEARMLKEGSSRIITLRLSSFDPAERDRLNNFVLIKGTLPGEDQILVSDVFAAANSLEVGDAITLVVEGTRITPTVSGLVQSPEYVYAIPDTGQLMPDNEAFGFGFIPVDRLGTITGLSGFATNLSLTLEEGYTFNALKPQLEDALSPYGLRSLIPRKDQPSHVMLDQQLEELETMAQSFPMLFILIAVIILFIMLKRMVEQERSQIGVLKAFGFSNWAILFHYIGYGAFTGLAGGILGLVLGLWLTGAMTPIYLEFFSLPAADAPPEPSYLLSGILIALGAGMLGAFLGTRSMLRLTPSEAMRPPAPPAVRRDLVGRLPLLPHLLSSYGYMSLRNITRNKFRSAFVLLGVAVSFAITAFTASYGDMFDALMLDQFTKVELYNLKISLAAPAAHTPALEAAWALEGVRQAETMLELPVELSGGHLKKNVSITAMEADSHLYRIYDGDSGRYHQPPQGGVLLSSSLAGDLQAKRGDLLTMTTPYTGDRRIPLPVMGVVETNLGATAYIAMDSLWDLLEIPPTVSSVLVDAAHPAAIKASLLEADNISAITDQAEARQVYEDLLKTYAVLIYMLQLAGAVIAFAIITNTASISLSERQREYATMRVLGMHPREIGQVVGLEYWTLFLVSIPPGILLTRVFKEAMAGMIDNEMFSMPVGTGPGSFVAAAALCGLAVLLSNLWARRKIAGFDMAQVLKERE